MQQAGQLAAEHLSLSGSEHASQLNDQGVRFVDEQRFDDALQCFARALKNCEASGLGKVLGNLAFALYAGRQLSACVRFCARTLRTHPGEVRAHYLRSVAENLLNDGRSRTPGETVCDGDGVVVFRVLRTWAEPADRLKGLVSSDGQAHLVVAGSAPEICPSTRWGVLHRFRDELWCGFARPSRAAGRRLVLDMPQQFYVVQRRQWVRVSSSGAVVRVEVLSLPGGGTMELLKFTEVNLSAGGAAIRTVPELPVDTQLRMVLDLGEGKHLGVAARVIRIVTPEGADAHLALRFDDISEPHRERIARFLHKVQLQRLRGGS